jgi:ATP-dependent Lon protease
MLDPVPEALLDRMEVIELPGYIEEEKLEIARRFLVPKQLEANGVPDGALQFTDSALEQLVRAYTYEAGVRNLEREIGAVCRKTARRIAEGRVYQRRVLPPLLDKYLGPPRYTHGKAEERDEVGVATGMAYTPNGGDAMAVEVSVMEGKGGLLLTGQLGDVMQESAHAALSYARANARKLGIETKRFDKVDIHIHVPEGSVPKDGPSAGVTLATALISALTGRRVRRVVAMTGEITLRGRVLAVGGVRDKVLGAYRAGIATIILPRRNERDLIDVPSNVKRKLHFVYVQQMDEVLGAAMLDAPPKKERKKVKERPPEPPVETNGVAAPTA